MNLNTSSPLNIKLSNNSPKFNKHREVIEIENDPGYIINDLTIFQEKFSLDKDKHKRTPKIKQIYVNNYVENEVKINIHPHNSLSEKNTKKYSYVQKQDSEIKRNLQELKNVFDSIDEMEKDYEEEPWILIEINSKFQFTWELIMLLIFIYSSFVTPLNLCFSYNIFGLEILDICIEILLIFDIILSFYTQIEDFRENLISSARIISETYLREWFIIDLITCFPATLIQMFDHDLFLISFFKWFALVRMLKILKYDFLTKKKVIKNDRIDRILKQISCLVILIHILSCLFIYIGLNNLTGNNWIIHNEFQNSDNLSVYIASLYFHYLLIFTIGFGKVEGINMPERIYTISLLMLIFLIFPLIFISLSKIFVQDDPSDIDLFTKLNILRKMNQKLELGKDLKKQISMALKLENKQKFSERNNFFNYLPLSARHQLNCYIYKNRIQMLKFFNEQSYDFILFTIPLLRHTQLKKGHQIFSIGERVDEMFIISQGKVSLRLGDQFSNLEVAVLAQNQYFGDIFLLTNKNCPFNCKIKSLVCNVYLINSDNYSQIKLKYPKNIHNIIQNSTETFNSLNERKKKLINLFEQEKTKEKVISHLKVINEYLLQRDFDNYFYRNQGIEGVNEFLINNPYKNVKQAIDKMKRSHMKFPSDKIFKNSHSAFKILSGIVKRDEVSKKFQSSYSIANLNLNEFSKNLNKKNVISRAKTIKEKNTNDFFVLSDYKECHKKTKSMGDDCFKSSLGIKMVPSIKSFKNAQKPKIGKKQKKKIMKKKFLRLLKIIYRTNFLQELDINTFQKEKEMCKKISSIINNNKDLVHLIKDLEPEFQVRYDDMTPTLKEDNKYTFEKIMRKSTLMQKNFIVSKENDIYIESKISRKLSCSSSINIVKTENFQINSQNCHKSNSSSYSSVPQKKNSFNKDSIVFKPSPNYSRQKDKHQNSFTFRKKNDHIENENNSLALIVEKLDRIMVILSKDNK